MLTRRSVLTVLFSSVVALSAWQIELVLADEVICHAIPSDLARVRYYPFSSGQTSVEIELPRVLVWLNGEYSQGDIEEPGDFELARLYLSVDPKDTSNTKEGLGLRVRLEIHLSDPDSAPAESTAMAVFIVQNHESRSFLLEGVYRSVPDDSGGGCVSHLSFEVHPPTAADEERRSNKKHEQAPSGEPGSSGPANGVPQVMPR